jgi:hypothetical protein
LSVPARLPPQVEPTANSFSVLLLSSRMFGMDKVTPVTAAFERDAEARAHCCRAGPRAGAHVPVDVQQQAARGVMFEADPSLRGIKVRPVVGVAVRWGAVVTVSRGQVVSHAVSVSGTYVIATAFDLTPEVEVR